MPFAPPKNKSSEQEQAPPHDSYEYGWRYIRRELPDGDYELDRVPLTLADVLHPQEEDFIVHSDEHHRICVYLYNVLRAMLGSVATVLADVRIAWDVHGIEPHGLDIMVLFGVREYKNWSTFHVADEGVRPSLIIEVTSPKTRRNDLYEKLIEYDEVGVPYYIIVDIHQRRSGTTRRILGYQHTLNGYINLAPDERGRFWMEPVGLWIGIDENEVVCYDTDGNIMGDYTATNAARADAEARAAAEAEARVTAESRIRELEAELRRIRGE
jgi:Uma2 family endonuclease